MSDTNPANDFATGIDTIDPDALAISPEVIMLDDGLAHFDYDVEARRTGELVFTAFHGETDEGGPIAVHATTDRDEMIAWTRALVDDPEIKTLADLVDAIEDDRSEYGENVAAGWGDWLRGKTAREIRAARAVARG